MTLKKFRTEDLKMKILFIKNIVLKAAQCLKKRSSEGKS